MLTKANLQRLRALREKKQREAEGLFVVEGAKVVAELLAAGFTLRELYATEAWHPPAGLAASSAKLQRVTTEEMARMSHFPTPSPVLALAAIPQRALDPTSLRRGLTLALDGVQDAGNVGTLLRIADWFGFARVLLSSECADLFHQKVINASMGSFARVAAFRVDLAAMLAAAPASVPVFGCDLDGRSVYEVPPTEDAVVVVGSEGRGLSAPVAARISERVTIPRIGAAESLNAAVAAGIVCAQLRRR